MDLETLAKRLNKLDPNSQLHFSVNQIDFPRSLRMSLGGLDNMYEVDYQRGLELLGLGIAYVQAEMRYRNGLQAIVSDDLVVAREFLLKEETEDPEAP